MNKRSIASYTIKRSWLMAAALLLPFIVARGPVHKFSFFVALATSEAHGQDTATTLRTKEELAKIQIDDKVLGCASAPHTVIQYSSLSCPHCAEFMRSSFGDIKKNLIDKCKVRYAYREVPNTSSALVAGALASCLSVIEGSHERYYDVLKILYDSQGSWAMSREYAEVLQEVLMLNNFKKADIQSCLKNRQIIDETVEKGYEYQRVVGVDYTPKLIVDGKEMPHNTFYVDIQKAIKDGVIKPIGTAKTQVSKGGAKDVQKNVGEKK